MTWGHKAQIFTLVCRSPSVCGAHTSPIMCPARPGLDRKRAGGPARPDRTGPGDQVVTRLSRQSVGTGRLWRADDKHVAGVQLRCSVVNEKPAKSRVKWYLCYGVQC